MPEIKRRVRLAWACYSRFKWELYDMEAAPFALNLRMLKAEVVETLLYGCVTWTLGKEHFAELRTAHHRFFLRIIGFQRRQRTDHLMSYAKALKKAQCESVETTIRKRRLLLARAAILTQMLRPRNSTTANYCPAPGCTYSTDAAALRPFWVGLRVYS